MTKRDRLRHAMKVMAGVGLAMFFAMLGATLLGGLLGSLILWAWPWEWDDVGFMLRISAAAGLLTGCVAALSEAISCGIPGEDG